MTERPLRLLLAQRNLFVGDVDGNATRVLEAARAGVTAGADLVMLPELALAGYPPEDLLFHSGFRRQVDTAIERLCREASSIDLLFGYPEYVDTAIYNSAALIRGGRVHANHRKQVLPNYRVFDEKRYFVPGREPTVVEVRGARVAEVGIPLVYLNLVGGQDELVFDGNSFVLSGAGALTLRLPPWSEANAIVELERAGGALRPVPGAIAAELSEEASVYAALVLGVRDYVLKHRFPGVVMGLSGGVDSALTLAIAVDALGPERVQAVMMPSRYTSQMSREDA